MNSLLSDRKITKRLVLSTSDGKYVVPTSIKHWTPVGDFFRNHLTATLRPVRLIHKEKHIGSNVKYIIEFISHNGEAEVVPIHPEDHELQMFKMFSLTRESLESTDSLKAYLQNKNEEGLLNCKNFEIHDVDEWKSKTLNLYKEETIHARYYGFWKYHLLGRVATWLSDRALMKNEKVRLKHLSPAKVENSPMERAET
jgi:hypothetical protein